MPDAGNDQHIFKNINVPRVIYFDLQVLNLPVSDAEPDPDNSNTEITEKIKIGYGVAVVDIEKPEVPKFELKQGQDFIENLL